MTINKHFDEAIFISINLSHYNGQKQPFLDILEKDLLKISSKFTGEHPYRSVISIHTFFIKALLDAKLLAKLFGKVTKNNLIYLNLT